MGLNSFYQMIHKVFLTFFFFFCWISFTLVFVVVICVYYVKIKCVNSGNICDIYNKLKFTINYTNCTTTNTYYIKKHTYCNFWYLWHDCPIAGPKYFHTYSYVGSHSRYWTGVSFDKMFVFCDKLCVSSGKCVFIVVKTKCVNSD